MPNTCYTYDTSFNVLTLKTSPKEYLRTEMQEPSSSDGGGTLSMVDVLEENEELEEEAKAVLGDSDDRCCTYPTGYQARQALYACNTCTASEGMLAGICLACSYACHDGHELFELYTKRNFRCDCGNSKFPDLTCKLVSDKDELNKDNKYNQNFKGLYCSCSRPYPDPDDNVEDEMIQCVICEDWFHGRHLGIKDLPSDYEYQEMVCQTCISANDFLWAYTLHSIDLTEIKNESNSSLEVDIDSVPADNVQSVIKEEVAVSGPQSVKEEEVSKEEQSKSADSIPKESKASSSSEKPSPLPDTNSSGDADLKEIKQNSEEKKNNSEQDSERSKGEEDKPCASSSCHLEQLKNRAVKRTNGAIFWQNNWRCKLCTCQSCKEMYDRLNVSFLVREDDTVLAYEERGKRNNSGLSQYEKGMQALSHLDRTQQVEVIQGYNDMKSELRDFLQSFAANGKVVRTEDINQFFGEMQARKRQKTSSVQYFCR